MKKIFFILFSLTVLVASTFADKSRFYKNEKVIDTMYVSAEDGLRVRDKPSLKSNRLCGLPHRLPVKVVAIGKEEAINGITAPWVEILIPQYEWKSAESEYGWVFGGYLSERQPDFIPPKNAEELQRYLSSIECWDEYENNETYLYVFAFDLLKGKFWHGKYDTDIGEGGEWKALSENKLSLHTSYVMACEEDIFWNLVFKFEKDGSFNYSHGKSISYCYPRFSKEDWSLYSVTSKGNYITYYAGIKDWSSYNVRSIEEIIMEAIRWGISADGTSYEKKYHDYWNPIMAEHQKKTDEMK
ncbi:MAG: SH3 domain-containing protein [Treponema sp.]|uniref:SH3 domain-containing protein n=1 Tax=Treponema sp. TaxID=166 RepID=UPI00298E9249|nr:SH3 domain-containing protein [Treponema sp.]MCR5386854.1 SH3 domain-containing protein [Treponema sp.]